MKRHRARAMVAITPSTKSPRPTAMAIVGTASASRRPMMDTNQSARIDRNQTASLQSMKT
jgi:hypothetical protein